MAWSGSEKFTPKYVQTKPKEEKKQVSSFYDDFQTRRAENSKSIGEKNPVTKAVSKSKTSNSKKSATTSHTEPKSDLKFYGGYQSYADRKKNGRVFTPSTVLGRKMSERTALKSNNAQDDKRYTIAPGITDELNGRLVGIILDYDAIRKQRLDGATHSRAVQKLLDDNVDAIKEYEKQTKHAFSIPGLLASYEKQAEKMYNNQLKNTTNIIPPRKANLKDLTVESFNRGVENSVYGKELYDEMFNLPNESEAYRQRLSSDRYNFAPQGWLAKGVSGVSEFLGQTVHNLSDPKTQAAVATAGTAAALAGQAGFQAILPEEILSVPSAMALGYSAGSAANIFEIEAGHAYDAMVQNGISPETARTVALGVGTGVAALEAVQLDDLLSSFKILSGNKNTGNFAKEIGKAIMLRAGHVAKETGEELAQEGVAIAGEQIASMTDKGEWQYNKDEVYDRLKETATASAPTFALLGGMGDVSNAGRIAYDYVDTINETGRTINEQGKAQAVVNAGLGYDNATQANQYAQKMRAKQKNGEDISNWNAGRQFQKNVQAFKAEKNLVNSVKEGLGVDVELYYELANKDGKILNGRYDGNSRIDISKNGTTSVPATLGHEVLHFMQNNAPQAYQAMHKYVSDMINSGESNGFKERFNYHKNVNGYNDYVATEEIVAELAESLFGKKSSIDSMVKNNPKMVQSVLDGIKSTKAKIKDKFLAPNTNRTGLKTTYAQLDKFEQMFSSALREAVDNKGNIVSGEARNLAMRKDRFGNQYWNIETERDVFKNITNLNDLKKTAYNFIFNGANGKMVEGTIDGETVVFNRIGAKEYVYGVSSKDLNRDQYMQKMRISPSIEDLIENASVSWHAPDIKDHTQFSQGFDNYRGRVGIDGVIFNYIVRVGKSGDNNVFYDVNLELDEKTGADSKGLGRKSIPHVKKASAPVTNNISQQNPVVNTSGRSSLAGEHAQTANFEELQKAMAMDEKGIDAQTIWKQTGWGKGQDGLWRFEIDDSEAEYIGPDFEGLHHSFKLSEVLKHDKLYEAYPELKNLPVGIGSSKAGLIDGNGSYAPILNLIFLDKDLSNEEKREVLLHEAQHAIQVIENFAVGADYKEDGEEKYWRSAGELEARDVKSRADMTMKERRNTFPESMEKYTGLEVIQWRDHPDYEMKQEIEARIKAEKEKQRQKNRERYQRKKQQELERKAQSKMDDAGVRFSVAEGAGNAANTETDENGKISQLYENTMQKDAYTDEFKSEAERRKPEFMYKGITNKETYENAQADINNKGDATVLSELAMKNSDWTADDIAKSLALMAKYQTEGNVTKEVDVASMLREKMTQAGQVVQALKIVNKLTPEGQFIDFVRQAEDMVNKQIEKHPAKNTIRQELEEAKKKDRAKRTKKSTQEENVEENPDTEVVNNEEVEQKKKIAKRKTTEDKQENDADGVPEEVANVEENKPKKKATKKKPSEKEENNEQKEKSVKEEEPRSYVDEVLDKYKIEHLSENDMQEVNDVLKNLETLNDKNDLIDLILKQSKERKTASHALVKKALEGQEVEFLKDTAIMQIFGKISDKMPTSFAKKVSTYQALSHLLNARTMARNIVSNIAFNATDTVATDMGAIVDSLIGLLSGKRTVGVDKGVFEKGRFRASSDRAIKQYIDIALAVNHQQDSSKYDLNSARRTFKGRVGGGLERSMSYGLQATDEWAKGGIEHNVRKSLERLKKNGFTDEEIDNIAQFEAKYRTFQDDTKLSQVLAGLKDALNVFGFGETKQLGRLKSHEFGLGDLVQKYTQVPGALITRSVEYSPLGYCKALYNIGKAIHNKTKGAEFSASAQRNIALSLGRAMTGHGLIALFSMLSKAGVLTCEREDEDEKVKAFENAEGISNMQINLSALSRLIKSGDAGGRQNGDVLTSIGFLEPLNTLMAMGNAVAELDESGNAVDWLKVSTAKTFDQIMDMSTMSTIRGISNTLNYGGDMTDVAIGVVADSATGFVPSPVRQLGSFMDTTQRNPYDEENSFDKAKERFKATLPWAREDVAATINPYGEEKTNSSGNRLLDFANNFLSPGYVNIYQTSDISDELYRLSETSTDVLPHVPATSFSVDGEKYKPRGKDYEEYSRLVGTITTQKMRDIIFSDDYNSMSDEDKIKALSDAADNGEKEAKKQYAEIKNPTFKPNDPVAQQKKKQQEQAVVHLQTIADNVAKAVPDKADDYSASSMQINDIQSAKIDGKSYKISGDVEKKVIETANDVHYSNIEKLMNNEINVEDVVGYTSKGKARTSTQADGTKVQLTGKLYNDDGTPRFDEVVMARIMYQSKETAKDQAIEQYKDEITGGATPTFTPTPTSNTSSTKVSSNTTSSGERRRFTSAKASGGSSSKATAQTGNKVRFTGRANTTPTRRTQTASAHLPNVVTPKAVNSDIMQQAVNSFMKNAEIKPIQPLKNPLTM